MSDTTQSTPVWFITGCSTGFGHELAKLVLQRGWRAVVTARDRNRVAALLDGAGDRGLALDLDVTDAAQVTAAVAAAEERFGAIDVLVNNAGYGYQASVEEGEDAAEEDAVHGRFRDEDGIDHGWRRLRVDRSGWRRLKVVRIMVGGGSRLVDSVGGDSRFPYPFASPSAAAHKPTYALRTKSCSERSVARPSILMRPTSRR